MAQGLLELCYLGQSLRNLAESIEKRSEAPVSLAFRRYFRVLFADCIPVLLNDFYEPPFGEIFDSSGFVIRWPMQDVG